MAYVLTRFVPGSEGGAWVVWQVVAVPRALRSRPAIGAAQRHSSSPICGVSPILATLGTMTLVKGISIGITRGNVISGFPDPIVFIGNGAVFGVPVGALRLRRPRRSRSRRC